MTVSKSLGKDWYDELEEIVAIARSVGWGAADILKSYYSGELSTGNLEIQNKKGGPVTAADVAANQYILDNLHASFGTQDFGYLSEETYTPVAPVLVQPWVWIIDPLDGTRDFIDRTGEYAVHIALVRDGRPVLAVVACPEAQKLYYATLGGGTFVETRDGASVPVRVSERDAIEDLCLVVSRTHRGDRFKQLLQRLPYNNKRYIGSIGCKIAAILEQQADVYISLSGKSAPKDWDFAAPELILTEAGGYFSHLDGTPLKYNQKDVTQWGCLIASNGSYHAAICAEVEKILADVDSRG